MCRILLSKAIVGKETSKNNVNPNMFYHLKSGLGIVHCAYWSSYSSFANSPIVDALCVVAFHSFLRFLFRTLQSTNLTMSKRNRTIPVVIEF